MIQVHHLNNSRSQRVLWLLEELGLPYEIVPYQRNPKTMFAPPELQKIHPLGKSPVLQDGEVIVAESGAIIEYLLDVYGQGKLRPKAATADARRFTYFMHYAEGSLMSPLILALIFSRMPKEPMPFFVRPIIQEVSKKIFSFLITPQLQSHAQFLENELSQRPWFAGEEFSGADVQMSFPIEALLANRKIAADLPKLSAFLQRIHDRPGYQRALQRGGPLSVIGG